MPYTPAHKRHALEAAAHTQRPVALVAGGENDEEMLLDSLEEARGHYPEYVEAVAYPNGTWHEPKNVQEVLALPLS